MYINKLIHYKTDILCSIHTYHVERKGKNDTEGAGSATEEQQNDVDTNNIGEGM